jgi:PAS domain S-box-containing protein
MDQSPQAAGRADQHRRWVAMWREVVHNSPFAIGLVNLSTTSFIALSGRAAELLGTTPERGAGLNYLSVTERPQVATETFRLAREGVIDGIQGRRRLRRPDGSMVEMLTAGWAIRSPAGPDLGLWIAGEVPLGADHGAFGGDVVAPSLWSHAGATLEGGQIVLDERWRIACLSAEAARALGRPPAALLGRSVIELAHLDHLAALLVAFARATTGTRVVVRFRLREPGSGWRWIQAVPTLLRDERTWVFSLVVTAEAEPAASGLDHPGELAGHLRRSAGQNGAASALAPLIEMAEALGVRATGGLSARQWDIASRLVQGERVPTIAAELYLSQSTVRNHLSAIFQKFGVHSQLEFLALWRGTARRTSDGGG